MKSKEDLCRGIWLAKQRQPLQFNYPRLQYFTTLKMISGFYKMFALARVVFSLMKLSTE